MPQMNVTVRSALQSDSQDVLRRYEAAKRERAAWESLWQDCYDYALPLRSSVSGGVRRGESLYDATALDAVDQLAASLLGYLTPPWSRWFGLRPGPEVSPDAAEKLAPALEKIAKRIQAHFDHSNFAMEIHQSLLDLVVGGTACLAFEENLPGEASAFRFASIPLPDVALEEGGQGILDTAYRPQKLSLPEIIARYPSAVIPEDIAQQGQRDPDMEFSLLESVRPRGNAYLYQVVFLDGAGGEGDVLVSKTLSHSPLIAFRWMKSPGESYGRSPVMKALPDIKTANKVVELILKNASIAVTGIWQADDDGVLNPANIELVPGAIIPKAVGSKGLSPLEMPGKFDVSQIILSDLRNRIRHALIVDRLPQMDGRKMTATEVLERSAEMSLLLGATYGRLQTEMIAPLIRRAYAILRRRGEIPDLPLDGRTVQIEFRSPLARVQAGGQVQTILSWLQSVQGLGSSGLASVNVPELVKTLGEAMGVPASLIQDPVKTLEKAVADLTNQNS
jgi:hypothetical protein